jgi:hypothetical protein
MAKQLTTLAPIVENEKPAAAYSEAVKPFRVEIDIQSGDCVISFYRNRSTIVDSKAMVTGGPVEALVRSDVMEKLVEIDDPILQKKVTISVEGLIIALNALHQVWYAEDKAAAAAKAAAAGLPK